MDASQITKYRILQAMQLNFGEFMANKIKFNTESYGTLNIGVISKSASHAS